LNVALNLALPDNDWFPTALFQFSIVALISSNCAFQLFFPEFGVCFGQYCVFAVFVLVPETAIYLNSYSLPREYNIRLPR
jgi:hypothetical protein